MPKSAAEHENPFSMAIKSQLILPHSKASLPLVGISSPFHSAFWSSKTLKEEATKDRMSRRFQKPLSPTASETRPLLSWHAYHRQCMLKAQTLLFLSWVNSNEDFLKTVATLLSSRRVSDKPWTNPFPTLWLWWPCSQQQLQWQQPPPEQVWLELTKKEKSCLTWH